MAASSTPIRLRFIRSFYIRHAFVGGLALFFSTVLMLMLKQLGPLRFLAPVVFAGPWVFFVLREWRLAAQVMDEAGVTRRDGRRFLWQDLQKVQDVHLRLTPGQQGPLNNVDLHFAGGKVRILYLVLENGMAAIQFARKKAAGRMQALRSRVCHLLAQRARSLQTAGAERLWPELEDPKMQKPRAEPAWPERSTAPSAGQRAARKSRIDRRNRSRSASDRLSLTLFSELMN